MTINPPGSIPNETVTIDAANLVADEAATFTISGFDISNQALTVTTCPIEGSTAQTVDAAGQIQCIVTIPDEITITKFGLYDIGIVTLSETLFTPISIFQNGTNTISIDVEPSDLILNVFNGTTQVATDVFEQATITFDPLGNATEIGAVNITLSGLPF